MDSRESISCMGKLYACISARLTETALQCGIEAGVNAAINFMDAERQKARKGRYDRRLHNTRLLLKSYRVLKKHVEGAVYNAKQAKERAIDILEGLDEYAMDDGFYIESIKQSQQRTIIILNHIDKMLRYYQIDCEQNGNEEDKRRYQISMATYVKEPKKSVEKIAGTFEIDRRTVYKDINAAMKPLTALFFGIDSLKLA